MKEFLIDDGEAGQSLQKYLQKLIPEAPNNIIFKSVRKKNIVINGGKADMKTLLKAGDKVALFFADETFRKFRGRAAQVTVRAVPRELSKVFKKNIVFEDKDILLFNKPAGLLSQGDDSGDLSVNDLLLDYLEYKPSLRTVKPSVCNRLDRNTSGLVICGKTSMALKEVNAMLKDRSAHKYYTAIVYGHLDKETRIDAFLLKDKNSNTVTITDTEVKDSVAITTIVKPVHFMNVKGCRLTELSVLLVTGRPHQIRASLLHIGHPILGDPKYFTGESQEFSREMHISRQLLHAKRLEFPKIKGSLSCLSGQSFEGAEPEDIKALQKYGVK